MTNTTRKQEPDREAVFEELYGVEILVESGATLDRSGLQQALATTSSGALAGVSDPDLLVIEWLSEAGDALQYLIQIDADCDRARVAAAVAQSFDWPEAEAAAGRGGASISVSDSGAAHLPYRERLERFQRILTAVLRTLEGAVAIHWQPSQLLVDPEAFLLAVEHEGFLTTRALLNVRFFPISHYPGGEPLPRPDFLIDTLGLCAIGLHDLQCHFRDLDPNAIGHLLYNTALYVFHHGPVIRHGHLVAGLEAGQQWAVRMEDSIGDPRRIVLDLDPGAPFAAGVRV